MHAHESLILIDVLQSDLCRFIKAHEYIIKILFFFAHKIYFIQRLNIRLTINVSTRLNMI